MTSAIIDLQSLFEETSIEFLSYWTFSDIFEEQGFNSNPFHASNLGGFGMQTIRGIEKPVFGALSTIHSMDGDYRYDAIFESSGEDEGVNTVSVQ